MFHLIDPYAAQAAESNCFGTLPAIGEPTVALPAAGAQLGRVAVVAPVGDEVKVQAIEMIPA